MGNLILTVIKRLLIIQFYAFHHFSYYFRKNTILFILKEWLTILKIFSGNFWAWDWTHISNMANSDSYYLALIFLVL
jgi:hypothetical protein